MSRGTDRDRDGARQDTSGVADTDSTWSKPAERVLMALSESPGTERARG